MTLQIYCGNQLDNLIYVLAFFPNCHSYYHYTTYLLVNAHAQFYTWVEQCMLCYALVGHLNIWVCYIFQ